MISQTFSQMNFFQFGVGGTGSWLVPPLAKFLNNFILRNIDSQVTYSLVDNDYVDERNILRQNFNNDDIGSFKCMALIRRCPWFQKFLPFRREPQTQKQIDNLFNEANLGGRTNSLNIFLGCTDSIKFRRNIYSYLKNKFSYPAIYIDSGNNLYNGQILTTGFNLDNEMFKNTDRFKGINFHRVFPKDSTEETEDNCAYFGDQSQAINMLAANLVFINIQKIFIEEMLPANRIDFNSSGYSTFNILD